MSVGRFPMYSGIYCFSYVVILFLLILAKSYLEVLLRFWWLFEFNWKDYGSIFLIYGSSLSLLRWFWFWVFWNFLVFFDRSIFCLSFPSPNTKDLFSLFCSYFCTNWEDWLQDSDLLFLKVVKMFWNSGRMFMFWRKLSL